MTRPITINLDDAHAAELERIARESGLSVDEFLREIIDVLADDESSGDLPPLTEEERAKIERGIAQADRGQVMRQGDVEAWLTTRFGK